MSDYLGNAFPAIGRRLPKQSLAVLPTPISHHDIDVSGRTHPVAVKHDDATSPIYGGNKIRKLEYLFARAAKRGAERIATFGAAGSNHALATAVFARECGFDCTCFLAHQKLSPAVARTLSAHLALGTELVYYGGKTDRLALFRRYLQGRNTWVIPLGGSAWRGAVGFVNAGLELKAQIDEGFLSTPPRIYIANGTMGSAAGLALGLALAGLNTEVHAVRVADNRFATQAVLNKLMHKTATLLHAIDPSFPDGLAARTHVVWRDEFFAGGYAIADAATSESVEWAGDQFGLTLDTTYTGKAMAALLHDHHEAEIEGPCLFWNTYNSRPLPAGDADPSRLPPEFQRYFEHNGV